MRTVARRKHFHAKFITLWTRRARVKDAKKGSIRCDYRNVCEYPFVWASVCGANSLTHDSDLPPFNCQMPSTEQIGIAKSHTKAREKRETNSLLTQFQHVAIHQDNFTDRSPDYEGRLEWKCLTLFNEIFAATQMGVRLLLCCLVDVERESERRTKYLMPRKYKSSRWLGRDG